MGVNTKMFIAAKKEAIIEIMPKVIKELNDYSNGIKKCYTHDFCSFSVIFTVNGETRDLFVTHSYNDYSDVYKGDKIIFSLGCWGLSEEIMMVVAKAIENMGEIYYTKNDCKDDFVKYKI